MADIPMRLKPSTNVHEARYDPRAQRLTVKLNDGTFAVQNVDQDKAIAFGEADSHGKFFQDRPSRILLLFAAVPGVGFSPFSDPRSFKFSPVNGLPAGLCSAGVKPLLY
jgi:hypothetical protein